MPISFSLFPSLFLLVVLGIVALVNILKARSAR